MSYLKDQGSMYVRIILIYRLWIEKNISICKIYLSKRLLLVFRVSPGPAVRVQLGLVHQDVNGQRGTGAPHTGHPHLRQPRGVHLV